LTDQLGNAIRNLRETAGLSRQELADRAGISESAIARLERGQASPAVATLELLAKGLGLRLSVKFESPQPPRSAGADGGPKISVLVADSQFLVTQALAISLAKFQDLAVMYERSETGVSATGLEAAAAVAKAKPNVALIDYWMPVMDGPAVAQVMRGWAPEVKVLLTSWFHGPSEIQMALQAGAAGFLPKGLSVEEVAEAIRRAHAGESVVFGEELAQLSETLTARQEQSRERRERLMSLTPKEVDVLRMISYGLPTDEVRESLSISQATLSRHLQAIMAKTGAGSRIEAIAMARDEGLLQL